MDNHVYGFSTITIELTQPSSCVNINSDGINITSISASIGLGGNDVAGSLHSTNQTSQITCLKFDSVLPATFIDLHLQFDYHLEESLSGLYKSHQAANSSSLVVTQFEPISARSAFPSFDDPRFRTTFELSISSAPNLPAALSNMPLISSAPVVQPWDDRQDLLIAFLLGFHTYEFGATHPMPTHMVALVFGDLKPFEQPCTLPGSNQALPVFAWVASKRSSSSQVKLLLDSACSSLQTFSTALSVPYSLPKLDLVAIPNFSAGGMENWGLIILSESRVLKPSSSALDPLDSLDVAMLVAHEVSHQWFGNLVSIGSYAELWLKEGFATYFESLAANAFHAECFAWDQFYSEVTMGALLNDGLVSRPLSLQTPITSLSQYDSLFGPTSYDKGAAIVRMIRVTMELVRSGPAKAISVLGPDGMPHLPLLKRNRLLLRKLNAVPPSPVADQPKDAFMEAMRSYLIKYNEGVVSSKDLFSSLQETTGLDFPHWMTNWTTKPGYPIVSSSIQQADGKAILHLSQRPLSGSCNDTTGEGRWWVPISYKLRGASGMDQAPSFTALDTCHKTIVLDPIQQPYALVNIGRTAYFRSSYDSNSLQGLMVDASQPNLIPPSDLAGILDDAWQLSYLGLLDSWAENGSIFFMLCQGLESRGVIEYEPWKVALTNLERTRVLLATAVAAPSLTSGYNTTSCLDTLTLHINEKVTAPLIQRLGLNFTVGLNESIDTRLLRPQVLLTAGRSGSASVVNDAVELVLQSGGYGGTIPSSLRQVALQLAVSSGNASVLQLVKECYLSTSDRACLTALASCPPSDECLKLTLDPNFPREDSGRLLYDIASQGGGRFSLVWSWLIDKGGMDSLLKQWSPAEGGDHSLAASGVTYSLSRYLSMMTDLLMDATLLAKIESFASTYASVLDPDFLVAARQSFDFNRAWVGRGKSDCEWLDPSLKPDD